MNVIEGGAKKMYLCFLGVDYQIRRKFTFLGNLMIPLYRLIGDSSSELVIFYQIKQAKECTVECCHSRDNMEKHSISFIVIALPITGAAMR